MAAARKHDPLDEGKDIGFVTPEEYLARERDALTKSEYIEGEIRAMAGGTSTHAAIATDTLRAFMEAIATANSRCDVYNSDLKVRVDAAGPFFYPDASVVCDDPVFDPEECLTNPTVIIEVLSTSTAGYDRGEKFFHYRRLASLRHYVLIEQNQIMVEHFARNAEGLWTLNGEYTNRTDFITFDDLWLRVSIETIYRRLS